MSPKHLKVFPFISAEPLIIAVNRSSAIESVHEVDIALCDAEGNTLFGMGNYQREIFPRSAMKPLQAIALIELLNKTNKQDSITAAEIALICASHNGEEYHSKAVKSLLAKFQINHEELICGAHWSLEQESLIEQVRTFEQPDKTHNNCSGKHAGMIILAKLLTGESKNYAEVNHQAQQLILRKLQIMTGENLLEYITGIDGCGAPVYRAPLGSWARAFALFAGGGELPANIRETCSIIRHSIAKNYYSIAGKNRACSVINKTYGEAITAKVGAEGVYSAAFHDSQLGLMLKARDGSKRGAEVALGAVLKIMGYPVFEDVKPYFRPQILNWAGSKVGDITIENLPDFSSNNNIDNLN